MDFDEMNEAVQHAQTTINRSDNYVGKMANMIAGRLRNSNAYTSTLIKLKKELKDFNMHTCKWKDQE